MKRIVRALFLMLLPGFAFCQLPAKQCDLAQTPLEQCPRLAVGDLQIGLEASATDDDDSAGSTSGAINFIQPESQKKQGFRWGRALLESFMFLSIEQAYVVHDDYHWVTVRGGIPFNHYWSDYKKSLNTWIHSAWNDGDPLMYGYVGHPIQGALTSYIQIQNDPRGDDLEFSNTKEYWHSRFRATIWNAVYSTQWNIGPLSEITVEKYGTALRSPWNAATGKWPCNTHHCYTGVGQIDLVMTPVGGFAWLVGEDYLDKRVARFVEGETRNHFLIDFTRCAVNPVRGGASILHGRRPWYRARDATALYLERHETKHGVTLDSPAQ